MSILRGKKAVNSVIRDKGKYVYSALNKISAGFDLLYKEILIVRGNLKYIRKVYDFAWDNNVAICGAGLMSYF